jgi:hypothetical protein
MPEAFTRRSLRGPVVWGGAVGCLQAASPLAFFWLDAATVYAFGLTFIAAVYIGFAVADGRRHVVAVEVAVAAVFVVIAAAGGHRVAVADRRRTGRLRAQGPVAAPHRLRDRHPVVAAVLRRRRLGCRRPDRRRDHGRLLPRDLKPNLA